MSRENLKLPVLSRQRGAQTEVPAPGAERLVVGAPLHVELVGALVDRLVAVGRGVPHHDLVALADLLAAELDVVHGRREPRNVQIMIGATGPQMMELTGEIADGWIGTSLVAAHADVLLDPIRRGAERAGLRLLDIDVYPLVIARRLGEQVDRLLGDLDPGAGAQHPALGGDQGVQRFKCPHDVSLRAVVLDSHLDTALSRGRRSAPPARVSPRSSRRRRPGSR